MTRYMKLFAAVLATVLTAAVAALTDGHVTAPEGINIAISGVTAAAVFAAPNVPGSRYTKLVLAVLGAVLALLVSFISDGISAQEWFQLAIAALGALGVGVVPNGGSAATAGEPAA